MKNNSQQNSTLLIFPNKLLTLIIDFNNETKFPEINTRKLYFFINCNNDLHFNYLKRLEMWELICIFSSEAIRKMTRKPNNTLLEKKAWKKNLFKDVTNFLSSQIHKPPPTSFSVMSFVNSVSSLSCYRDIVCCFYSSLHSYYPYFINCWGQLR